jgi:hypothetical protein
MPLHNASEREKPTTMAPRIAKSYTGASLEFEKLPVDGVIHSMSVGDRRFELDPPVAIEAVQRVADLVSVDVLFGEPDADSLLA